MSSSSDIERDVIVASTTRAADGVRLIELRHPYGLALPAWEPGAHIDVILPLGERQYSLVGEVGAPTWTIGVLRETDGRGGSAYLHDTVAEGARLRVRGPRNHFAFQPEEGRSYLFLAGGIGITPIRSMVAAAKAAGVDYLLAYAGRSRATMAFVGELEAGHPDRVAVYAADEGARLDLSRLFETLDPTTVVYCCGPTRLIDAVEAAAGGVELHLERFEAKHLGEPVLHEAFEVELAVSGETLTVPPERSILEVVEEAGVLVLSSCREGTCGTCETVVLEGEVDHRDSILSPQEQAAMDVMYICVSRAACPRLVLEL
ncbi:PDR/VanB family oxidoreductase [Galbitalea soli]|uniref:Oxidoreductase n=1 Tax=Galbitalea soli TaxID=1268042 RepID=A0A7C9TRP0_9MICO|nr:PDR/VanB family oxidoreductase [Galbitalea soli]NEM91444.1 oxidoreductase [Galbitalea soli]NYJ30137.1 ferredoxin-NADP reductase [Galbitalea soli]